MTTPAPQVRTRIEPSPSGSLHVGNALTASFNWLWARKHGGAFVLRIADTDRQRVTEEGIRSALEDLRWLGLGWDEGPEVGGPHEPYFQSQRFELYHGAVKQLIANGAAYPCYCTPDELDARRKAALAEGRPPRYENVCRTLTEAQRRSFESEGRRPAYRFRMPEGRTEIADGVRGPVVFEHEQIEDFVIARADGSPLYMLAAAYDDMAMGMTHVIRGEDIFPSTPKQIQLMLALGHDAIPSYAHIPLLVGPDRQKLSKRHGPTAVIAYRDLGYLPDVLVNYLCILDWSVGDGVTERFTIPDLIDAFDLSGVTRNPSAFDPVKLTAMNGERIRDLPAEEFVERSLPFLVRDGVVSEPLPDRERAVLLAMAPLVAERVKRLDEVAGQVGFLFHQPDPDERAAAMLTADRAPALEAALDILQTVEPWSAGAIQEALTAWADGAGIKRKEAFQPLRAAITGRLVSPPLFESIEVLGRELAVARVRAALDGALRA